MASFSWTAATGFWGQAANWGDVSAVPGSQDTAAILGAMTLVGGPGQAAELDATALALSGAFSFGDVSLQVLDVPAESVVAAGAMEVNQLAVSGAGARAVVSGTLTAGQFGDVIVSNHGFLQAGALAALAQTIDVGASGTLEIGGASGAAAGVMTVDGIATFSGVSEVDAPVVVAGTLVAATDPVFGGLTQLTEAVTGSGTLLIDGSVLVLDGAVSTGVVVDFSHAGTLAAMGGTLELPASGSFAGVIAGLSVFDTIDVAATDVLSASYSGTTTSGTLTLVSASGTSTLRLSGNYLGMNFLAVPVSGAGSAGTRIQLAANTVGSASAAPAGTSTADAYTWIGTTGGAWSNVGNWADNNGTVAPGTFDTVVLGNITAGTFQIITGNGNAASIDVTGQTALSGTFNAGSLTVQGTGDTTSALLEMLPGGTMTVGGGGLTVEYNSQLVLDEAVLTTGVLSFVDGQLNLVNHADAQFQTLELGTRLSPEGAPRSALDGGLSVDASSVLEIGTAGGAAAGVITVDAGFVLSGEGNVVSPIANNGTIAAIAGNLFLDAAVNGTGVIQVGTSSELVLLGTVGAGQTIGFAASSAYLDVSNAGIVAATITGFSTADAIYVPASVASISFTAGSGGKGTLALLDASGSVVADLTVTTPATGQSFLLEPGLVNQFGATSFSSGNAIVLATASGIAGYINAGSMVTAASLVLSGTTAVSGAGALLHITGMLSDSGSGIELLSVTNHAVARFGTVSLAGGTLSVGSTATMEIGTGTTGAAGVLTVDAGKSAVIGEIDGNVVNKGTLQVGGLNGALTNNGTLLASADGSQIIGNINGTGLISATTSGEIFLTGTIGSGQTIDMSHAAFVSFAASGAGPVISGLESSDTLELVGTFDAVSYSSAGISGGTLTVSDNGTAEATLMMAGDYSADTFIATPQAGSIDIQVVPALACFARGTRIATARGNVAVEALRVGDEVVLAAGGTAPVTWLGHRRIDCARHPRPHDVHPVRIVAGAFAPGRPARDLVLSPDHAVRVGGYLIPVRYLINGASVVQEHAAAVTYWHVELPAHDILLAENMPAESYLDTGNRSAFIEGGPALMLHADFARDVWGEKGCAELAISGAPVAAARRHLLSRAASCGHSLTDDPDLRVMVNGRAIPALREGKSWRVALPAGVNAMRLVSRDWVPAWVRPEDADTRRLGVAIGDVRLDGRFMPVDHARFGGGWERPEGAWRWSDGAGVIALRGERLLEFELIWVGNYWSGPVKQLDYQGSALAGV